MNIAGLPFTDNSEGVQGLLSDPSMELDPSSSKMNQTECTPKGVDGNCVLNTPGAEPTIQAEQQETKSRRQETSWYTTEPFVLPGSSPEKKKRKRGQKRTLEELLTRTEKFQKFIVLSRVEEQSFTKVSPFLINKIVTKEFGAVESISKMSNGALLIEANSKAQSQKIISATSLGVFGIKPEYHKTLNTSRGVITCFDLEHSTDEEILEGLKDQGVIAVRRFFRKKKLTNGTEEAVEFTGSVLLTFDTPEIPSSVNAAFYKLRVRPYVPPPLKCFKCQKFGHSAMRCKSEQGVCVCGYPPHSPDPCPTPPKCPNCEGSHNARSRDCMEFKIEQEIQKMRMELKELTFKQARVLVTSESYAWGSYSGAARNENIVNRKNKNAQNRPSSVDVPPPTIPKPHLPPNPQPIPPSQPNPQPIFPLPPAIPSYPSTSSTSVEPRGN